MCISRVSVILVAARVFADNFPADDLITTMKDSPDLPPGTPILFDPVPKLARPTISVPAGISPLPLVHKSTQDYPDASLRERPNAHRRYTIPNSERVSDYTIFYVGPESLALTNLLMTHPVNTVRCQYNISALVPVLNGILYLIR
jgi:diphthamide biosynthesis protein 2